MIKPESCYCAKPRKLSAPRRWRSGSTHQVRRRPPVAGAVSLSRKLGLARELSIVALARNRATSPPGFQTLQVAC